MRGFVVAVAAFAASYFLVAVPLLQRLSRLRKGRPFVIRLREWDLRDSEQRRDLGLSVLALLISLTLALVVIEELVKAGVLPRPPAGDAASMNRPPTNVCAGAAASGEWRSERCDAQTERAATGLQQGAAGLSHDLAA